MSTACSGFSRGSENERMAHGRGSPNTADWDVLYYASGWAGTVNPSTNVDSPYASCGHTSYNSQGWGNCPVYNLSSPPSACVPFPP